MEKKGNVRPAAFSPLAEFSYSLNEAHFMERKVWRTFHIEISYILRAFFFAAEAEKAKRRN